MKSATSQALVQGLYIADRWVWVYSKELENIPVTFQVGIVATDGVILASDTRVTQIEGQALYSTAEGQRLFSTSEKIVVHDEVPRLAYCWAGDQLQSRIAHDFSDSARKEKSTLSFQQIRELLIRTATLALIALYPGYPHELPQGTLASPRKHTGGSVLVAYPGLSTVELWKLRVDCTLDAFPVRDKTAAGDTINPAIFFLEKYYRQDTIDKLLPLAVHTILTAAALNPKDIGGLEIVTCRNERFERLPAERIAELTQFSQTLDRSILELLTSGQ
jgi:hypothetical protein